jgi:N-acetylglucosaminyl transferase component (Gpi1)
MTKDRGAANRVLVIRSNNQKRQRNGGTSNRHPSGWVLGWKDADQETTVVASFLPTGTDLKVYQDTVSRWMQQILSENQPECACLTDSLQVMAFWENNNDHHSNDTAATTHKANLPILSAKRGYPWWKESASNTAAAAAAAHQQPQNRQLVFYSLDDAVGAHFVSECGTGTDWARLLNRINHCQEVEDIIVRGIIPPPPPQSPLGSDQGSFTDATDNTATSTTTTARSGLEKFKSLLFYNSLTFLHIQHSCINTSWADCIPLVRCIRFLAQLLSNIPPHEAFRCDCCSKPCRIPSRSKLAQIRVARLNAFLASALDAVMGFFVAVFLLYILKNSTQYGAIYLQAKLYAWGALQQQVAWLETFPAGFKLNVPLTHNMGHEIRNLLHHQGRLLHSTLWNPDFCRSYGVPLLAAVSAVGGGNTMLAIVVDVWRLENLHLIVMAFCFRQLYQAELYLLSALFRLFRGKKRNILRQRTDSMEYDVMQLLVGTIAFCICVFLWTTLLVYYTFFVLWNLAMHLPVVLVWVSYATSRSCPWGSIWYRLRHPSWFPKDLYLQFLPLSDGSDATQITALRSIAQPPASILSRRMASPLNSILKWCLRSLLELLYPHSSNPPPVSLPLEPFMRDFQKWDEDVSKNRQEKAKADK